ncbi:MAG: glycosyltransferase family 4 protein [Candidatus Bathyarchaeia archaeon]
MHLPPVVMLVAKGFQIPEFPRAKQEAETLSKAGYRVSVVAWDRYAEFPALENTNGIIVHSIRSANLTKFSKAGLMIAGLLFQVLMFVKIVKLIRNFKERPIINAHDINTLPVACFLRRIHLCSGLVYECREFTYGVYYEWFNLLVASIVRVIEERLLRYADAIITVNDWIAGYLNRFNQATDVIYNCPRLTDLPQISKKEARKILGLPLDTFIVSYVGGIRYGCMLDLLLKVASMTRGQDIHYVVVGEGPLASEFRRAARQISGASLTVAPRVPRNIALLYVRSSDLTWSVYQQRPESLNERTALGWKLFESLACGVPVIVNANTLSAQLVKRFKCGLVFEGNNPDEMVQLILGLSANTNQFLEMSRKAMHTSTTMNFNWETMGSKLLATYRRIALS